MKYFWKSMKMPTRIVLIAGIVAIAMALIFTGQIDLILDWIK